MALERESIREGLMAKRFDPYSAWLGLKTAGPPNFYELLGLDRGVSDQAMVQFAVDQRLKRLADVDPGPHENQLSALQKQIQLARDTLLDPSKRLAYDEMLGAAQAVISVDDGAAILAQPPPPPPSTPVPPPAFADAGKQDTTSHRHGGSPNSRNCYQRNLVGQQTEIGAVPCSRNPFVHLLARNHCVFNCLVCLDGCQEEKRG